jgi:hypothetical protein
MSRPKNSPAIAMTKAVTTSPRPVHRCTRGYRERIRFENETEQPP